MKHRSLKLNAILNLIKQGCSIIFPLITFPYVSRILGSKGFGQYNFSFSIADYFIIFAALGTSSYAIREGAKNRDKKETTTKFCCEVFTVNLIATIISMASILVLLICVKSLNPYIKIILIIASQMILTTLGADWINSIYEDYLYITLRYLVVQLISLILIFLFVNSSEDVWIYALITTFAATGGNLINIWYIRKYVKIKPVFSKDILHHLRPILILFANTIAISIYVNADITMLKFFRDDSEVGIYSLASRIYNILKRLINAIVTVTTARLAFYSKNDKKAYSEIAKKTLNALMVVMIPSIAGLIVMSKPIIRLVGGNDYIVGWIPLCILSIAMIFALVSSFYSNCILIIFNCDRALLTATLISALVNIILNVFMLPRFGMNGAAITTLIAECVNCVIQFSFSRHYLNNKLLEKKDLAKSIIGSILFFIACIFIIKHFGNSYISLLIGIPISCFIYLLFNLFAKNKSLMSLVELRKQS